MKKYFIYLTMCFLAYSCKSYSQDLSLDVNNYYGTWQQHTWNDQDELIPTNNYYIFKTDGTLIRRHIGSKDNFYKYKIVKEEDTVQKGTFYATLLIMDSDDISEPLSYAPDLIFDDSESKFYLHLEYKGNFKTSTYLKIN